MSLLAELKRRNVFRVALAYIVLGWLLLQVADTFGELLSLPGWTGRLVLMLLALGFVPALVFSWIYELTPEGLKRESEVSRDASVTHETGRRLNLLTLVAAVAAIAVVALDRWDRAGEPTAVAAPVASPPAAVDGADGGREVTGASTQAASPGPSIAVLPFVNMSADPENAYFADGLSEELLNRLAQVPGLRVAGRTSSFAFKDENRDLREIGAALGVANVLEGSVRRDGRQVRITAQLIEAENGTHLWSETYDRELDSIFAVQDEIAERVSGALDIVLDDEARRAMQAAGVRDVDAFVAYQKGDELFWKAHESIGTPRGMEIFHEAMVYLEEATRLYPEFSTAWIHQVDYWVHVLFDQTQAARWDEAVARLQAAFEGVLAGNADAQRRAMTRVDQILFSDDWRGLVRAIDEAVDAEGCATGNWLEVGNGIGFAERLVPVWERAVRCEPLIYYPYSVLADALRFSGRLDDAVGVTDRWEARLGPSRWSFSERQVLLLQAGRIDDALAAWMAPPVEETEPERIEDAVRVLARAARLEDARAVAARSGSLNDNATLILHAMVGDREGANALASSIDVRPGGPLQLLSSIYSCACGAPFDLEATPRLAARLAEAGVSWPPPTLLEFPAKDG